jgi:hypothetical protein
VLYDEGFKTFDHFIKSKKKLLTRKVILCGLPPYQFCNKNWKEKKNINMGAFIKI